MHALNQKSLLYTARHKWCQKNRLNQVPNELPSSWSEKANTPEHGTENARQWCSARRLREEEVLSAGRSRERG